MSESAQEELVPTTSHKKKGHDLSDREMVFNYQLLHGQHVVENAFAIAASRFRVLLSAISMKDESNVACVVLQNFLTKENISVHNVMARLNVAH